jgi:hypothetical protein
MRRSKNGAREHPDSGHPVNRRMPPRRVRTKVSTPRPDEPGAASGSNRGPVTSANVRRAYRGYRHLPLAYCHRMLSSGLAKQKSIEVVTHPLLTIGR